MEPVTDVSTMPARSITAALLAPVPAVDRPVLARTVSQLQAELASLAAVAQTSGARRVTDHTIRTTYDQHDAGPETTPFSWSARTARRTLGLTAVRSLLRGEVRTPADGVRAALAQAIRSARDPQWPATTLDRWITGLSAAGRAAVHAEAVTWATRFWCALDWPALPTEPVIGRDHWWDSPHSSLLSIRSRAEVRFETTDTAGDPTSVHLALLGGTRRPSIRAELSVVALVECLRSQASWPAGRIMGWWPDSGHFVTVDVDAAALTAGMVAIRRAVTPLATVSVPQEAQKRAAA
jgi:hypothetical protein